jgi:hypothetical protein
MMPDEKSTQRTPNEGYEIPVPTRGQIDDALAKAAKPMVGDPKHPSSRRRKRGTKK